MLVRVLCDDAGEFSGSLSHVSCATTAGLLTRHHHHHHRAAARGDLGGTWYPRKRRRYMHHRGDLCGLLHYAKLILSLILYTANSASIYYTMYTKPTSFLTWVNQKSSHFYLFSHTTTTDREKYNFYNNPNFFFFYKKKISRILFIYTVKRLKYIFLFICFVCFTLQWWQYYRKLLCKRLNSSLNNNITQYIFN